MRPLVLAALTCGLALPVGAQDAPLLEAHRDGALRELGVAIGPDLTAAEGPVRWSDQISVAGADYFRLLIRNDGAPFPPGAELRISPGFGETMAMDLAALESDGTWSPVIYSSRARLSLWSEQPLEGAVLMLEGLAVETGQIALYSYYGTNDLMGINADHVPDQYRRHAPAVAMLHLVKGRDTATCTGFLIAPDRLMTNEHCVNSELECKNLFAVFGREIGFDKRMRLGPTRRCAGFEPARPNYDLDAAVILLNEPLGPEYVPVPLDEIAPPEGDLYIIQHPSGQPKQVSFLDCRAMVNPVDGRVPSSDFSHTCDTAGGSSGAPVFDMQHRLVGLHHFGFEDGGEGLWLENRAVLGDQLGAWLASDQVPAPADLPASEDPPDAGEH